MEKVNSLSHSRYDCNYTAGCHLMWAVIRRLDGIISINDLSAFLTASESGKYFFTSVANRTAPSSSLKYCTKVVPSA